MKNKSVMIAILAVGVFSILNTEMGIIGILPDLAAKYGMSIVDAGVLVSLFALAVAISGPVLPLLLSRFDRKKVMLTVLAIFTVCNTISVAAPTFSILLAARVIPAFFHPVFCALAFAVAGAVSGPRGVAKINMGVAAGMVVGVPISNFLAEAVNLTASMSLFAILTGAMFVLTLLFVPGGSRGEVKSYGAQLSVLKRPVLWVSILAAALLNGSIFGVYNYLAGYLADVTRLTTLIPVLLFVYGVMNLFGSWLGGELLAGRPFHTVFVFPLLVLALYGVLFSGGGFLPVVAAVIVVWGVLGGINANITQFWVTRSAADAPDLANGIYLTGVNLGTMAGTWFCGLFIEEMGMAYVVFGGALFALAAWAVFALEIRDEAHQRTAAAVS